MRLPNEDQSLSGECSTLMEIESKEEYNFWQSQHFGFLLACISAVFFGALLILVSLAVFAGDVPLPMIIWARFACFFLSASIWGFVGKIKLKMEVEEMKLLVGRSVFGITALATSSYALQILPVGETAVIQNTCPVFVAILSSCFLADKLGMKTVVLITVCMVGVVMTVDPRTLVSDSIDNQVTIFTLLMAFCAPVMGAISYILIKKSKASMHYIKMCFWFSTLGIATSTVFIIGMVTVLSLKGQSYAWVIRSVDGAEFFYLIGITFTCAIAQITMTASTQIINTTSMSLIRNLDIIFTMLFQVLYFKEIPSAVQAAGIIVMVVSTVVLIVVKERTRLEDANENEGNPGKLYMERKGLLRDSEDEEGCNTY